MKLNILCILFLILLINITLAEEPLLSVFNANCEKDGSLTLIMDNLFGNKIYTKDITITAEYNGEEIVKKTKFEVSGKWNYEYVKGDSSDRTKFVTDEATFNLTGEYILTINYIFKNNSYSLNYKTECPGIKFSCKLLNIFVDNCRNINNKNFEASVRIYGLGKITSENLSLDNNIGFIVQADKSYEDVKGELSNRGDLPKLAKVKNPYYGQYYFNITSFNNKIKSFVAKFVNINYIEGGCVNYPNISLYSYRECEDVTVEEKKIEDIIIPENITKQEGVNSSIVGQVIKEIEIDMDTKKVEESKKPLIILGIIFTLCLFGALYIVLKRNFNKEPNF